MQLLDSALGVFVAQGYHAAAMDDIAERAGVSKPVLYQHFPGKLDLYLALLDAACDQVIDNCRQALASTPDNKTRVVYKPDAILPDTNVEKWVLDVSAEYARKIHGAVPAKR